MGMSNRSINLEIKDFLDYTFLSRLQLSPDKKTAALVSSKANWEENGYKSYIHLIDMQSEEIKQLTYTGDSASFIWLNNNELLFPAARKESDKEAKKKGEKLTVFQKISINGGEASEFFRVPYAVTEIKKIDDDTFSVVCACHSSDKDFSKLDDAGKREAYKNIEEERDYEVLDEIPFWSNGDGFTNKKRTRLFILKLSDKSMTAVTDEYTDVSGVKVKDGRIIFIGNRFTDKMGIKDSVYCYDISSGKLETLVQCEKYRVDWVDFLGDKVVMKASPNDKHGLNQNADFYTISGGEVSLYAKIGGQSGNYTNSDSRYGGGVTIRVSGDSIYYTAVDHVQNTLRRINADGSIETLLCMNETVDGFDVGSSGIIYYGLGALFLQEVFTLNVGVIKKISSFNDDVLANKKLSKPEPLTAQGEQDTVEGFVMKPVDFDPTMKYPAILHIHGGPKTAFGDTFYHEAQLWANRGYFVLICNPWGSDGRGDEFADLRGRYGTIDYNDLMAFTDKALDAYTQINKDRLAVGGGSYGGYMTNWMIGHTDRFCCAVSMRSISNWISKFGTTDIGYYFNADQILSTPWEDYEKMWWHSPLKYADKCKTPTLFIHSEEDYRCWLAEGLQMFTALKYHGVPARLCMFRGENHELSRSGKPKHRVRRLTEIINWLDEYCKK